MDNKKFDWQVFKKAPWWTWIFFVLCLLLPVVTLGGAVPAALAVLGILLCFHIASVRKHKTVVDILLCLVVTLAMWGVSFCFIFLINSL